MIKITDDKKEKNIKVGKRQMIEMAEDLTVFTNSR